MLRRSMVCCALVAAVACGAADSVAPPQASLDGIWTLRSVNNAALPYTLPYSPNGYPTTILAASLTISGTNSGSYTEAIAARVVTPLRTIDTSLTYSGTWSMNGTSITFNDQTFPEAYQGSLTSADTMVTVVLFGYSGEYSR